MAKPKPSRKAERKRRRKQAKTRGLHTQAGTLVVDPEAPAPVLSVCSYGPDGFEASDGSDAAELRRMRSRWPVTWVHVVGLGDVEVIEALGRTFGIHRLALADVVHDQQRPKVQRWGEITQIVARMVDEVGSARTEQLSVFVGHDFVLSFEARGGELFAHLRERLRDGLGELRHGKTDFLAYALLDAVIDAFFPVVEQIGDELDQIEDDLPAMTQPQLTPRLRQVKHDLLHIRRALWPLRDVLGGLASGQCPHVQEETRNYLRDCQDHCAQLIDIVGTYRELAADLVDLQLAVAGQRLNEVMKVLTVMATVFIPLTFISSIYGMNFDPETSPLALGLIGATTLVLLVYFRRRGWI
jgi:magnesium transporter